MAHVYEKTTKDTVDLSAYVLCFIKIIQKKLEFYGFIDGVPAKSGEQPPSTLVIPIVSRKFQYCYDAIELIEKTFRRKGFNCSMKYYKHIDIDEKDGSKTKGFSYEYEISKIKK